MDDDSTRKGSRRTRGVIDRLEEGWAAVVLEIDGEGVPVDLPASLLPEGAEAGSHLVLNLSLDEGSRREAEERIKALQERLEKRSGSRGQKSFKL